MARSRQQCGARAKTKLRFPQAEPMAFVDVWSMAGGRLGTYAEGTPAGVAEADARMQLTGGDEDLQLRLLAADGAEYGPLERLRAGDVQVCVSAARVPPCG